MKQKLLFIFFLLLTAFAQSNEIASANKYHQLRSSSPHQNADADSLFLWVYIISYNNMNLADSLSNDFLLYAQSSPNNYLKAKAFLLKASMNEVKGETIEGIQNALSSAKLFDKNEPSIDLCFAYQTLGRLYKRSSNIELANDATQKGLKMAELLNNAALIGNSYNSLGVNYNREKKFNEAKQIFMKLIALQEKTKKKTDLSRTYTNIGISYRGLQQFDSAVYYSEKALKIAGDATDWYNTAYALSDIGCTYLLKKQYEKAILYLNQAAQIRENNNEYNELAWTYMYLGSCYAGLKEMDNAKHYYYTALNLTLKNSNHKQRYELYQLLAQLYHDFNVSDSAFYYNNQYVGLKDSVMQAEKKLATDALIASYQLDQKEKENILLNEETKKQQLLLTLTIVSIAALLIIILLVIRARNQRISKLKLEAQLKETIATENLNKEKERISRDLHDNVGAQLSYLITNLEWILQHPESIDNKAAFNKRISALSESGRNAMLTLRETIWAISHKELSAEDFADRFKQYVLKMTEFNTEIEAVFKENIQEHILLSPVNALNTFRICQEAFHNALKHSHSTTINIEFKTDSNFFWFIISDKGIGFDTTTNATDHYGLINMKSRAMEIGGTLTVESIANKGTVVILKVPYIE